MLSLQTAVLLGLSICTAFAQAPGGLARDPKSAEAGLALYRRHCSSCHGNQAEGGRAPNLTSGSLNDAQRFRTISDGIPNTEMAPYGSRFSSDDIWRIVIFLSSAARSESAVTGDATRGAALFWGKGGCGNCHAVGNRGSHVGPDLSGIGRQRNVVYLRESLVEPGADIARGFDGVTVLLRDGATVRGLERALDDFSVVLQDFSGKVYSFDRKDVRSVALDQQSLMPGYSKTLSPAELDDVLAFLDSLRNPRAPEVRRR
jgi:cytochrome c oxidase cbb3-type subunit 3